MSMLLRRTISSSAAKSESRRRFLQQCRGSRSATEMLLIERERFFWRRAPGSAFATTATSSLTSAHREQDERRRENKEVGVRFSSCPRLRSNHVSGPTIIPLHSRRTTVGVVARRASSTLRRTTTRSIVRYTVPPSSIRAYDNLNQGFAAEKMATDMALKAFHTWANQYQHAFREYQVVNNSLFHKNQQIAFISTNNDGSRVRSGDYQYIVRTGIRKTPVPTPESGQSQRSMKVEDIVKEISKKTRTVVLPAVLSASKAVLMFLLRLPVNIAYYIAHPAEARERWADTKQFIKDEVDHYWVGTKLLWADLKTARALIRRTLRGSSLTRRERKQLLRTISDLFRLIPFSMFIIIPMMEFALPFALKVFPNLLPSTFQDSLKAEENMKRELQMRIAMAKFFQETMEELAKEQKRSASHLKEEIKEGSKTEKNVDESVVTQQEESAQSMLEFLEKARNGEMIPNEVITRYAHYFQDDLTLDNMPRMQLINMCKYMSIPPYGSDSFLRFQLRHRMRSLREDDQRILWEGIDSLTKMELREACQERGMRSTGLSKDAYKRALQQWLDLSVKQNIPTSLLIMSRTFFLREEMFEKHDEDGARSLSGLADAISGLDKEVVNEVILDVATSQEKMSDPGVRKIKLEVLMKQNELIEQEQAEREEAAAKKKEQAEKEKLGVDKDKAPAPDDSASVAESRGATQPAGEMTFNTENISQKIEGQEQPTAEKASKDSKVDEDLSTAEMDAISQLVSADPVSRERADLESIKSAMSAQNNKDTEAAKRNYNTFDDSDGGIPMAPTRLSSSKRLSSFKEESDPFSDERDDRPPSQAKEALIGTEKEPARSTHMSNEVDGHWQESLGGANDTKSSPEDGKKDEDPVVARLKKRIESMVDKIEVQLSDVQVKIGDKLHFLDKDMDGILSVDEIADVLQQVLKRKITREEAYEIAQQMDDNKDGALTVQELIQWIETNQLVRFVEEGRDADMDRIIEKQSSPDTATQAKEDETRDTGSSHVEEKK